MFDLAFGDVDIGVGLGYEFEDFKIASDFLLVAVEEFGYVDIFEEGFDLGIGHASAFDAGGAADAADGGDLLELLEEGAKAAVAVLEGVDAKEFIGARGVLNLLCVRIGWVVS